MFEKSSSKSMSFLLLQKCPKLISKNSETVGVHMKCNISIKVSIQF